MSATGEETAVEHSWVCHRCDVEGQDSNPEPTCWNCGKPATIVDGPTSWSVSLPAC